MERGQFFKLAISRAPFHFLNIGSDIDGPASPIRTGVGSICA